MRRSISLTFAQSDPREQLWAERITNLPNRYFKQLVLFLLEEKELDLRKQEVFDKQVKELLAYRTKPWKSTNKEKSYVFYQSMSQGHRLR